MLNLLFRLACARGDLTAIKSLLAGSTIELDQCDEKSARTGLHYAVIYAHPKIVKYLLSSGAHQEIADATGKLPLHYIYELAEDKADERAHIRFLLFSNWKEHIGTSPSVSFSNEFQFLSTPDDLFVALSTTERAEQLSESLDLSTNTPLECQYMRGQLAVSEIINELRKDSSIMTIDEKTRLISIGDFFMAKFGAVFTKKIAGHTLIHLLAMCHKMNIKALCQLVRLGCDPNAQVGDCQPFGYRNTAMHTYLANENIEGAKIFVRLVEEAHLAVDFTKRDIEGKTALLLAAKIRRPEMVAFILEHGGVRAIPIPDYEQRNILHVACILGDYATFCLLQKTEYFAELMRNHDEDGKTPQDLLMMEKTETRKFIASISIDPDRDANAPYNRPNPDETFVPSGKSFIATCLEDREKISAALAAIADADDERDTSLTPANK